MGGVGAAASVGAASASGGSARAVAHTSDRGMMRGQRGQVMAFIAVALGMVLMPLAAYAIDVATVSAAAAALEEATATAAIHAAQPLDVIDFRAGGPMTIEAGASRRAAAAVLAADAPSASVSSVTVSGSAGACA